MNVGDCVYLRLEGFNPSWRQAVVVAGKKNGSFAAGRSCDSKRSRYQGWPIDIVFRWR